MRKEVSFHKFLGNMTPNYLEKEKFWVITKKKKLLLNLYLKIEDYYLHFFYQAIEIVINCILNRFQQEHHIDTLQKIVILLLQALRDEDFDHELQQMSSFFISDLHKSKLKTQLKTLTHIVDKNRLQ